MITEVSIKNISLADNIEFDLSGGFNVFTGETGAGKSLVISAIAFAFAMNSDFVKLKKENCVVLKNLYYLQSFKAGQKLICVNVVPVN